MFEKRAASFFLLHKATGYPKLIFFHELEFMTRILGVKVYKLGSLGGKARSLRQTRRQIPPPDRR